MKRDIGTSHEMVEYGKTGLNLIKKGGIAYAPLIKSAVN